MIRRTAAILAAAAMLLVLAVPVMAGGWAEIVADGQTTTQPKEGSEVTLGFKVLQHGETPAGWETATVHLNDAATGESFDVVAKNDRADGHFVATVTFPNAGYWSWQVTLQNLESDHLPQRITVLTASGELPPFDPSAIMAAIDRAKVDVRDSLNQRLALDIERLDQQDSTYRARIDNLTARMNIAEDQRDAMAAQVDALQATGTVPILVVISLSVLAGAAAGFTMAWLAGRPARQPAPGVALHPDPRGADPV
jgi:hypothetical protein